MPEVVERERVVRVDGALVVVVGETDAEIEDAGRLLTTVVQQCGIALERARLESRERDARRRTLALQALSGRLAGALVPSEVIEAAVEVLAETFGPDLAVAGMPSREGLELVVRRADGEVESGGAVQPLPSTLASVAAGVAAAGSTVEGHGLRQLEDVCGREASAELAAWNVRSLMIVPLRDRVGFLGDVTWDAVWGGLVAIGALGALAMWFARRGLASLGR